MSALAWLVLGVLAVIVGLVLGAALIDRSNRKRYVADRDLAEFSDHRKFRWNDREQR